MIGAGGNVGAVVLSLYVCELDATKTFLVRMGSIIVVSLTLSASALIMHCLKNRRCDLDHFVINKNKSHIWTDSGLSFYHNFSLSLSHSRCDAAGPIQIVLQVLEIGAPLARLSIDACRSKEAQSEVQPKSKQQ